MINKIIDFFIRNKLITGVILVIFIFWGINSFNQLSADALPDVTNNQVQVMSNSPNNILTLNLFNQENPFKMLLLKETMDC